MSWRAGTVVLKSAGRAEELAWTASFVAALNMGDRLRVPRQVQSTDGGFVCDGWAATEWLEGQHRNDRWDELRVVARLFHYAAAQAAVVWPRFMKERDDPWSRATNIAWGEEALPSMPSAAADLVEMVSPLLPSAEDLTAFQVIHSDLAGNVLFADDAGLPPAVIDISPQFRSARYAEAILVADAVAWNGAPLSFIENFITESPERIADLARAVIFRVATEALFANASQARDLGEAEGSRRLLPALRP